MAGFNDTEVSLLKFLKDEFLANGQPVALDDPVTKHADVMGRFSLSEPAYREIVSRLETRGIVEAVGLDAGGFLVIDPGIVEVVRDIEEQEEPMRAKAIFDRMLRIGGEDFLIRSATGKTREVRGLRNGDGKDGHGRKYIGFKPEIEVKEGDIVESKISGECFRVVEAVKDVVMNQLMQVKAYCESESAKRSPQPHPAIHIEHMHNSAIMQNSPGATQILTFTQTNKNDALALVAAIRESLGTMAIDENRKNDLLADVQSAESQLKKSSPNPTLVKTALNGVWEGLQEVVKSGANAVTLANATALGHQIWDYLQGAFS